MTLPPPSPLPKADNAAAAARLETELDGLRPWSDAIATAEVLQVWAAGVELQVDDDLLDDVAEEMATHLGRGTNLDELTARDAAAIAAGMVLNVADGRAPTDWGSALRVQVVDGSGRKTRTHYRWKARTDGGLDLLQHDLAMAELTRPGRPGGPRSPAAAARWLERHGDANFRDAPPARKRA